MSSTQPNPFEHLSQDPYAYGGEGFHDDYPFSNDRIDPQFAYRHLPHEAARGFVISVGSVGAALSLMTGRPEQVVVNIDRNPAVTKMANHILELIEHYGDDKDLIELVNRSLPAVYTTEEAYLRLGLEPHTMRNEFQREVENYSTYHWSVPQNLSAVAMTTRSGLVVPRTADIGNPAFQRDLSLISASVGPCTLLNLTNAHMYFDTPRQLRATLDGLPLAADATITFSINTTDPKSFQVCYASSKEAYFSAIRGEVGEQLAYL
ncbi:MAG: hypothetical protein WAW62_01265 [Candidatus Saccharimonas aalborgensis]